MSSDDRPSIRALLAAPWLAAALFSLGIYFGLQRNTCAQLLRLEQLELSGDEVWLAPATFIATNLLLLSFPAAAASVLFRCARARAARVAFFCIATLIGWWLMLDADVLSSVGRHVLEVGRIALLPEGHQAGGNLGSWALTSLLWLSLSAIWATIALLVSESAVRLLGSRLSAILRVALTAALIALFWAGALVPHSMHTAWRNRGVLERLYSTQVLDFRLAAPSDDTQTFEDPVLSALAPELRTAYRAAFARVTSAQDADRTPLDLRPDPPNVVLIVAESLRHDVFEPELMPRLFTWSQGGTLAAHHDAGTMYSESGMFALLYGRSPAVYHQTLDANVPPQLCVTLRESGYECAYFSGHPKVWNRREEYLNPDTMDRFVHDDSGDWVDWDRSALSNLVDAVNHTEKPLFALVFLMSSHFEYRYPKEYEKDLPVASSKWRESRTRSLGKEDELPHKNRYRNCMRFIDDIVADAIGALDPKRNLVVFTGDHGESIYDDGTFTHGYSFSEITTRTPLALVGPEVPQTRLEGLTEHRDLVATVAGLLSNRPVQVEHTHGRSWFIDPAPNSAMVAYATLNQDTVQAQLRTRGLRLRFDLGSRRPSVLLFGFEDAYGHPTPTPPLDNAARSDITRAFHEQLEVILR